MHGRDDLGEKQKLQIATGSLSPPVPAGTAGQRRSRPLWREAYVLVVFGAGLGVLAGALFPDVAADLKPLGDAFISLIRMTIAPLIFLVVVHGNSAGRRHGAVVVAKWDGDFGQVAWVEASADL
jgi:hypothetical protein